MAVITWFFRESLSAQLELTLTKAHSEQLARSIAEEQVGGIVYRPLFSYVSWYSISNLLDSCHKSVYYDGDDG